MSSTLFTIGTALNRAHQEGLELQLLVEGEWIGGQVAWVDGQGVLVVTDTEEHAIIRLSSISAVKVHSPSPVQPVLDRAPSRESGARGQSDVPSREWLAN